MEVTKKCVYSKWEEVNSLECFTNEREAREGARERKKMLKSRVIYCLRTINQIFKGYVSKAASPVRVFPPSEDSEYSTMIKTRAKCLPWKLTSKMKYTLLSFQ